MGFGGMWAMEIIALLLFFLAVLGIAALVRYLIR